MSDTDVIEEIEEIEGEEQEAEGQSDQEIEAEARTMGWKPESEWKGSPPPNGFMDASEFVSHGKTVLPIVQSQMKGMRDENAALKRRLEESDKKFGRLEKMGKIALDQQRKQLEAEVDAKKRAAVDMADPEAYDAANEAGKQALKAHDDAAKVEDVESDPEPPAEDVEKVSQWQADNSWFNTDLAMTAAAQAYINKFGGDAPLDNIIAATDKFMREQFPHKFNGQGDEPQERRGSPVEGGSRVGGGITPSRRGGAFAKLPKEAREQAEEFIDEGLFFEDGADQSDPKAIAKARENYAAEYEKYA